MLFTAISDRLHTYRTSLIAGLSCSAATVIGFFPTYSIAQVVPDTTLSQPSTVTTQENTISIEGGTQVGQHLFHSFETFSVPAGTTAIFQNQPQIRTIFSRITGDSVSNINGILSTNHAANLVLLNPNGISFGPNARLNIGGSFLASTAESIHFADGTQFRAQETHSKPLLTVSVPVGLQYGKHPGNIQAQSSLLQVSPTQTIGLLGGNISLEAATAIVAPEGRIELGSVAGQTTVSLDRLANGWGVSYERTNSFLDINIAQKSAIETSGAGGGTIHLSGRNLELTDGSLIQATTRGPGQGGTVTVNATETLELRGTTANGQFPSGILAETEGSGNAGDVEIEVNNLTFQNGGQVSVSALANSQGQAGNITVRAEGTIALQGYLISEALASGSGFFANTNNVSGGGNINVRANRLIVQEGAQITTATSGVGESGDITIDANSIELAGTAIQSRFSSGIFSNAEANSKGNGGDIDIHTQRMFAQGGAQVSTITLASGNAGDLHVRASELVQVSGRSDRDVPSGIFTQTEASGKSGNLTIDTEQLLVTNSALVSSATLGSGKGGTLEINAERMSILRGGQVSAIAASEGEGGKAFIRVEELLEVEGTNQQNTPSGLFTQTQNIGSAGNLEIATERLSIRDGGKVSVSGTQPRENAEEIPAIEASNIGNAGNLIVNSDELYLEQGILEATTISGDRGNIILNSGDLRLRETSKIDTDAQGNSQGGNIEIDTDTLVAFENSDITANAANSFGGRVVINTQGIYGTEFRDQQTPQSDITATSELGPKFSGIVEINTPEFNPTQGLVLPTVPPLPDVPANPCAIAGQDTEFVSIGRGGLPPTPKESVNQEMVATTSPKIQEAQGWVRRDDGTVELVMNPRHVIPYGYWLRLERPDCSTDSEEKSDR